MEPIICEKPNGTEVCFRAENKDGLCGSAFLVAAMRKFVIRHDTGR